MEIIQNLERVLMPHFQIIRDGLSVDFPELEHRVYSNTGGGLTPHPWHVMGVICLLHRDWDKLPNEVMIQVAVNSLKSRPTIEAYVMWDYPLLASMCDLFPRPVSISVEIIKEIERRLPELLEALKREVRRGKPPVGWARTET